jgi:selenocysteine-specific elongation factor
MASELRRRRLVRRGELARMGIPVTTAPVIGDLLADPHWWDQQRTRLRGLVHGYAQEHPLAPSIPVEQLRQALDLPERQHLAALVTPPLVLSDGRVRAPGPRLPAPVQRAVEQLCADLDADPFQAPAAARLMELELGPRELAAAAQAGALIRIAEGVVLATGAPPQQAARVLAGLPQPFTVSQARQLYALPGG